MELLHRHKDAGQRFFVVFDIGSGSVGGAFVRLDPGQLPQIIFSAREDIPFQEKLQFSRFLESMIHTMESLFVKMQRAGGGVAISDAFVVLSSPWYASQTRIVEYDRKEPFAVTERGVNKLLEREIGLFKESKLFSKVSAGGVDPVIIEAKNIQMKLNGYPVTAPFGKTALKLDIALYLSMTPGNIHKNVKEAITKFWHISDVHFSSFSFTAFDTLRDLYHQIDSFLFMDIAGEVTDLSLVQNGVLLESLSFPAGKNMLIRALMQGLQLTSQLAQSALAMYLSDSGTDNHSGRTEEQLIAATKEWSVFFSDALKEIGQEFPIPRMIFYTADMDVAPWFEQALNNKEIIQGLGEAQSFALTYVGQELIAAHVNTQEAACDPFLGIETVYAHKFLTLNNK